MDKEFERMLDNLHELTLLENEGIELSEGQTEKYIKFYNTLTQNNIEIPFGVEI